MVISHARALAYMCIFRESNPGRLYGKNQDVPVGDAVQEDWNYIGRLPHEPELAPDNGCGCGESRPPEVVSDFAQELETIMSMPSDTPANAADCGSDGLPIPPTE